ncbi:MAG TPA: hypothetical protein VLB29_09800 [Nocardioidaceae bacterium]|nr:hypothetical protein [Nocardioidaceae bacterium]
MRKTLLVGLGLTVAAVLVVFVSAGLDLDLEPVALLGVALGGVIALVPDRSPLVRLAGFAGGFSVAWVGYLLRAGLLPDSAGGRAVAVAFVVVAAVAIAALTLGRVPLWSTLLGAAAFAGAYEYTYAAAPPEVASTSLSAATSLLLTVAVGLLAAAAFAPGGEQSVAPTRPRAASKPTDDAENTSLDDLMMENAK